MKGLLLLFLFLPIFQSCPESPGLCDVFAYGESRCTPTEKCKRNTWYASPGTCLQWHEMDERLFQFKKLFTTEWTCKNGSSWWIHPKWNQTCPDNMYEASHRAREGSWNYNYYIGTNFRDVCERDERRTCLAKCPYDYGYDWVYFPRHGETKARELL